MKVMLLTETLLPGGAEGFVVRLANALADHHQVTLVVMHSELIHPALRASVQDRVHLEAITLAAKPLLWKLDSALRRIGVDWSPVHRLIGARLRSLVEREKPDIIHSHLLHADRLAAEAAKSTGGQAAHVVTVHGDYAPYLRGEADPRLLQVRRKVEEIVAGASAIVGVAHEHLPFFKGHFPGARDKLHLIYNGYAASPARAAGREALGLPADKLLFGMVSRGVEKKGWAEAVAAFQALGAEKAALVLVGEGPAIDRIRREVADERIILAGFAANPLEFILHFDVCLLPTLFPHESLPTAIVEYLACGKPVIATKVGEIERMLSDESGNPAGLLLDFSGGIVRTDELASKMAALIENAELRSRLSEAASRAFAKFDMAACAASYHDLYQKVSAAGQS